MKPEKVLKRLSSKSSISLIEAERGILASILNAVEEQRNRNPGSIEKSFGSSLSSEEETSVIQEQLRDVIARYREDLGGLNCKVLEKSANEMESRLGMEEWNEKVVEKYREEFNSLVEKSC
ncbi:MAG: hypothetical protein MUP58_01275 [Candidatus Nanohaloarchaeota archaeon QJJ-9]|nr:hypothetical protein [Candidatus Nanohaloarchaeota archaeon QJJ-9]